MAFEVRACFRGVADVTSEIREAESLDLVRLRADYRSGRRRPSQVIAAILQRIAVRGDDGVWIARVPDGVLTEEAGRLDAELAADPGVLDRKPLFGVPFAIKDNIDLAGLPTTAACPAFAYRPARSAPAVQRLCDAGAIALGKTNLDQFATGLVGVRTPYGIARNPFDARYLPGGSSAGSAVAVASGLASFALGTDTAGSGRVPAGFNNIVGLKQTIGLVSTSGVVPACRALDVVSIFALTVPDSLAVLRAATGFDADDVYSRSAPPGWAAELVPLPAPLRLAVPRKDQRRFFGNAEAERLFEAALVRLQTLGAALHEIDYAPLAEAAAVLYSPAGVAERTAALDEFLTRHADEMHPVTRQIVTAGRGAGAVDVYRARDRLRGLKRHADAIFADADALVLPTSGTIWRIEEVLAEPVQRNSDLGWYTNFVNQLDLAALAVPNGFQPNGLPAGITLVGPAFGEPQLAAIGDAFHRASGLKLGATAAALPQPGEAARAARHPAIDIAVFGAHMRGLPLNRDLLALGARFAGDCRTAPVYRFYRLAGGGVARPGLVRVAQGGVAVAGEIWHVPSAAVGALLASIPQPLGLGDVQMADGTKVKGFLCEAIATEGAEDISPFGDWRTANAR